MPLEVILEIEHRCPCVPSQARGDLASRSACDALTVIVRCTSHLYLGRQRNEAKHAFAEVQELVSVEDGHGEGLREGSLFEGPDQPDSNFKGSLLPHPKSRPVGLGSFSSCPGGQLSRGDGFHLVEDGAVVRHERFRFGILSNGTPSNNFACVVKGAMRERYGLSFPSTVSTEKLEAHACRPGPRIRPVTSAKVPSHRTSLSVG